MENFANPDLHGICLKVFEEVARATSVFILPLFLGRIVFSNVVGEGSMSFQTLKGLVIYFILIAGFPIILEILFSIPETFLPKWQGVQHLKAEASATTAASLIPFSLDAILETALAGLYWIAYYLHVFFMILMSSMAPIIFLTGTLLGVGIGLEIFMGLLILGSSWPILWYGFDQVHTLLSQITTDPFAAKCLELLVTVFKGLAPVTLSSLAIKSPAGQIITKSTKALATGGNQAFQMIHQTARSTNSTSNQQNYQNSSFNSHTSRSQSSGLRKVERSDFERLLGDRFRKEKERGEK